MKRPDEATRMGVADEVLEYLAQHPDAQDTLEGVCDWWLLERRIRHTVAEVQTALRELTSKGLMLVRRGKDGNLHYRSNRQREQPVREHAHGRPGRAPSRTDAGA